MNWNLLIPWRYGTEYKTLAEVHGILAWHYHPEYLRRLCVWLHSKDGKVGIGGHWRSVQPDKDGFAPGLTSFHLDQEFNDGFVGAVAVDLVYADGPDAGRDHDGIAWSEVPVQGSAEAARWGVHCNIGTPSDPWPKGEAWHMQPVEIDGHATWIANGRPAPVANYPLPGDVASLPPVPTPDPLEDSMLIAFKIGTFTAPEPVYEQTGGLASYVTEARWADLSHQPVEVVTEDYTRQLILVGPPHPQFVSHVDRFRAQVA